MIQLCHVLCLFSTLIPKSLAAQKCYAKLKSTPSESFNSHFCGPKKAGRCCLLLCSLFLCFPLLVGSAVWWFCVAIAAVCGGECGMFWALCVCRVCVAAPAQGHAKAFHGHRDSVALAALKPPSKRFHMCTETLFHILLNFIYIKLKIYFWQIHVTKRQNSFQIVQLGWAWVDARWVAVYICLNKQIKLYPKDHEEKLRAAHGSGE